MSRAHASSPHSNVDDVNLSVEEFDLRFVLEAAAEVSTKVLVSLGHKPAGWIRPNSIYAHFHTAKCRCCDRTFQFMAESTQHNTWTLCDAASFKTIVFYHLTKEDVENRSVGKPVVVDGAFKEFCRKDSAFVCKRVQALV